MNDEEKNDLIVATTWEILERFEELLHDKGIYIPSDDREGKEDEACIYGTEYYDLESKVHGILEDALGVWAINGRQLP